VESAPGSDQPDTITKAPMKAGRQTRTRGPLAPNPPSRGKMFARGLVRHCPWCGSGHLFHAYFKLDHHCPRCGLRFQRLEGQWSGDIGINTIVTFGLLYVTLMVGVIAFWGRINITALAVSGAFIVFVFPALFVPFAKTLWLAIDLMMRPAEADEFLELTGDELAADELTDDGASPRSS
jgi:uncharacterized protein (DUF983 family)